VYVVGEDGNFNFTGENQSAYEAGVVYQFSQNATIVFKVQ
jgi:hypothetical protein